MPNKARSADGSVRGNTGGNLRGNTGDNTGGAMDYLPTGRAFRLVALL